MKSFACAFLAAAVLAASAAAQILALPGPALKKIGLISGHQWDPASSFQERGTGWCEHGSFVDGAVLAARKEIRLACSDYGSAGAPAERGYKTHILDADARPVSEEPLASTGTAEAVFQNVGWLERGKAAPLAVTWDFYRARTWNEKGSAVDLPVTDGVSSLALLSAKEGGPMIVVGHGYGEKGLDAYRPDGKRLWSSADATDVQRLSAARLDGRPVLAVWHGVGRLALLGPDGKVRERLLVGGNSDRMLLVDGKEPRLYAFDSGAGSKRETLRILTGRKGKEGRVWEQTGTADLGPITITAYVLGRFERGGEERVLVGTNNGWVFLLDASGRTVASRKFLSPVRSLTATDLDGDGRDELVVILDGASQNVVVFSPLTIP